jgi:predicted DNA binding CopG/RHH family protein
MDKKKKIPHLKSDEDIAAFWDSHDFTDYTDDTEPAPEVVFQRKPRESIGIRLEREKIKELKRLSHKVGLNYTSIIRSWIIEKLAKINAARHHKI